MGHTKYRCWKKNGKGPSASANFLEVLVKDEEATLIELNRLCGIKHNVRVRMPKHRMPIQAFTSKVKAKVLEEEIENLDTLGLIETSYLSHFVKGKISLTPMETILIFLGSWNTLRVW
jgi:hypothetical protein